MSDFVFQTWIEDMWDKYREEYLAECRAINHQADQKDFIVWLEDKDLVPEYDER